MTLNLENRNEFVEGKSYWVKVDCAGKIVSVVFERGKKKDEPDAVKGHVYADGWFNVGFGKLKASSCLTCPQN